MDVAVCNPLRYPVFMNHRVCLLLAAGAWFGGSLDSFLLTSITMNVPYCIKGRAEELGCQREGPPQRPRSSPICCVTERS